MRMRAEIWASIETNLVLMRGGKGEKGKREEKYGWLARLRFARVHSAQPATRHAQQTMRNRQCACIPCHMYVASVPGFPVRVSIKWLTCMHMYAQSCMLRVHARMYNNIVYTCMLRVHLRRRMYIKVK